MQGVHAVMIIDESGSMAGQERSVVEGVKEYLSGIKDTVETFTLIAFSGGSRRYIFNRAVAKHLAPRDLNFVYRPNDVTPLYDVLGDVMQEFGQAMLNPPTWTCLGSEAFPGPHHNAWTPFCPSCGRQNAGWSPWNPVGGRVFIAVHTDGLNNASHRWDLQKVKDHIAERERMGWGFVFLGEGPGGWAEGAKLGIANNMSFSSSRRSDMYRGLVGATSNYTAGKGVMQGVPDSFVDEKDKAGAA